MSAMASCRVTRSQNAGGSRIQSCNFASIEYLAVSRSFGLQNSFSPSKAILLSSPTDIASVLRTYGKFQDTKIKGILVTYKIYEILKVDSPDHNFLINKKRVSVRFYFPSHVYKDIILRKKSAIFRSRSFRISYFAPYYTLYFVLSNLRLLAIF